jgi:hypothetical protein
MDKYKYTVIAYQLIRGVRAEGRVPFTKVESEGGKMKSGR